MTPHHRRDLVAVDEDKVVADYEAGVTVAAICDRHQIPVLRLYHILDEHRIARRRPQAPRPPAPVQRRILADYAAGVTNTTIERTYQISSTRLYEILDQHRIPRRRPNAPRLPAPTTRLVLADYAAGIDVVEIARRRRVAPYTVSKIAQRHGVSRIPKHTRDDLVDLVVCHLNDDDLDYEQREAITRFGCRPHLHGLRALKGLDPEIADEVRTRLAATVALNES